MNQKFQKVYLTNEKVFLETVKSTVQQMKTSSQVFFTLFSINSLKFFHNH